MKKPTKTKVEKMKPKMPPRGKRPYVVLRPIRSELMLDSKRYSSGSLGMAYERAEVTEGDKIIGSVTLCMGCGVMIDDAKTGRSYGINPLDIWKAFMGAKEVDPNEK